MIVQCYRLCKKERATLEAKCENGLSLMNSQQLNEMFTATYVFTVYTLKHSHTLPKQLYESIVSKFYLNLKILCGYLKFKYKHQTSNFGYTIAITIKENVKQHANKDTIDYINTAHIV